MKTKKIAIDKLIPDPNNARKHSEKNLKAIRGSIKQFGQVEPLVVQQDTMKVIGGNGRLEAFKELGFSEVDVVLVDLDNVKAKALALALNKTAELAEWDEEELLAQLEQLEEMDFDIGEIGFEVDNLVAEQDLPSLDEGDNQNKTCQMTFTFYKGQDTVVQSAIEQAKVKNKSDFDDFENDNSNGNAIYAICKKYLS